MSRCPKTAEEAFKRLDKRLTKEEKQEIVDLDNMSEFHFGLGMWIRNYWVHTGERENLRLLLKDLGIELFELTDFPPKNTPEENLEPLFFIHPDSISSEILDAYQKHLKGIYGK
jgi:hypothetical protein